MDDKHNELVAYVLDNPEEAALEIQQLRKLKEHLIGTLERAHGKLIAPMPDIDSIKQAGEYAERCGYARGSIECALDELRK